MQSHWVLWLMDEIPVFTWLGCTSQVVQKFCHQPPGFHLAYTSLIAPGRYHTNFNITRPAIPVKLQICGFFPEETHKSSPQETLQLSSLKLPRYPLPGAGVGSCLLDGKAVGNASAAGLGPSTFEGESCRPSSG